MGEKDHKPPKARRWSEEAEQEYDAGRNLEKSRWMQLWLFMGRIVRFQSIGDALNLNPIKSGRYSSLQVSMNQNVAEKVQDTFEEYRETQSYKEAILLNRKCSSTLQSFRYLISSV